MQMTIVESFYAAHQVICNVVILVLVFGGMARIAFWRDRDGLRVGGPLALGLTALLTVAALTWAREQGRSITEFGPWAAFILLEAIVILGWAAFRKSTRL
jgi:hypothetical protein